MSEKEGRIVGNWKPEGRGSHRAKGWGSYRTLLGFASRRSNRGSHRATKWLTPRL